MAKVNKVTRSFNAGELSPLMDSRSDQEKYNAGAKTMENFYTLIFGGAKLRPGLEYIASQKVNSAKAAVVEFEHSIDDTYILTFENQSIRFFTSSDRVMNTSSTVSAIVTGSGGTVDVAVTTTAAHQLSTGDVVRFSNVGVTTEINYNGNFATEWAVTVVDATSFTLDDTDDDDFSTYTSGGTVASIYELTSPYLTIDIPQLKFEQSADVMFIAHPAYEERKLSRTGNAAWFLEPQDLRKGPFRDQNTDITQTISVAETTISVDITDYSGIVAGTVLATSAGHGYLTGDTIVVSGTSDYNGTFTITIVDGDTFYFTDTYVSNQSGTSHGGIQKGASVTLVASGHTPFVDGTTAGHLPSGVTYPLTVFADYDGTYSTSTLVTATAHGFSTADVIQITGTVSYNGQWNITKVDANTFYIKTAFVADDAAGEATYANYPVQTGALYSLKYSALVTSVAKLLATNISDDATDLLFVPVGQTIDYTTNGTWGMATDSATAVLERSYDGTNFGTVTSVTSAANKNVVGSFKEEVDDATYRWRISDVCTDATSANVQVTLRDPTRTGIVEITAVASTVNATAIVRESLGESGETAITATHRWSEGSFSLYRGRPIDVTISSEERLQFAGNLSEPLTTWGSVIADFTDFTLGTLDGSGIQFTLVGSGQQNRIRWMVAKEALILGTVGGEHLLGASKNEEALTPTNVKAKLQTTYGSEDISAKIVNQAVLFVQRGGKKVREFLYNFESDAHKADDLTVFAEHITGEGIVDMAFQRTPDPRLWCVRSDGVLAVLTYERDQNVFSWYRYVTEGSFESVGVIYGGARQEDEVWVTIKRNFEGIDSGADVRYIERFKPQDFGKIDNIMFLDSAKVVGSSSDPKDIIIASDTVRFGSGQFGSSLFGGSI